MDTRVVDELKQACDEFYGVANYLVRYSPDKMHVTQLTQRPRCDFDHFYTRIPSCVKMTPVLDQTSTSSGIELEFTYYAPVADVDVELSDSDAHPASRLSRRHGGQRRSVHGRDDDADDDVFGATDGDGLASKDRVGGLMPPFQKLAILLLGVVCGICGWYVCVYMPSVVTKLMPPLSSYTQTHPV